MDLIKTKMKLEELSQLIGMVDNGTITVITAKNVFEDMLKSGKCAKEAVSERGLFQICYEDKINRIVQAYTDNNPEIVYDYKRAGKSSLDISLARY